MAQRPIRTFSDMPMVRRRVPLIFSLTGSSGSGKTYSALRIASGIQREVGGDIWGVDTESLRMAHYADYFKVRHLPFDPPYGPLDYLAAFEHCVKNGAKIVVVDSMSHEHDGEGGVLDMSDRFLEEKCGTDWDKRNKMLMSSFIRPKAERKKLNRWIVAHGDVIWIFCYRAHDKIKPIKGKDPEKMGWTAITTSDLVYEMTARFLLEPGSEGKPTVHPEEKAAAMMVKNPRQFQSIIKPGEQLSEELGQRMARWALGGSVDGAASSGGGAAPAMSRPAAATGRPAPAANPAASSTAAAANPFDRAAPEKQAEWVGFWAKNGAPLERVLAQLGRRFVTEITVADVASMKGWAQKFKANAASLEELFPREDPGDVPTDDPPEPGSDG